MLVAESALAAAAAAQPLREAPTQGTDDDGRIEWTTTRRAVRRRRTSTPTSSAHRQTMPMRLFRVSVERRVSRRHRRRARRSRSPRCKHRARRDVAHDASRARERGFTLIELMIALALLALHVGDAVRLAALAGTSWDGGEAKAEATSDMRLAQAFLRAQLEAQHPLRMRKIVELPLLFGGERDELRYAAALPPRVAGRRRLATTGSRVAQRRRQARRSCSSA